jgi:anti-sigma factor RsiW
MWRTNHRDAVRSRLLTRIAACAPMLASSSAGRLGAPRSAEEAGPPASLSVAPEQGPRKSSSRSASRGPSQCTFWLTLSPALVAVVLFCLLGLTISAAVILHLPQDLLNWVLIRVE